MRGVTRLIPLLLAGFVYVLPCLTQAQPVVETRQLNDHLYQIHVESSYHFNVLLSVGEDGAFLVDTGFQFTASELRDAIREITDKPIRFIALSHSHTDHIGGLDLLSEDATIIGRDNCFASSYFNLADRRIFEGPTVEMIKPVNMRINGELIKFIPLKPAHSDDEMLVYFVDSNVLYVGSSVIGHEYPYADARVGDLDKLFARMDWLANEFPDVTFSLAHGQDHTAAEIRAYVHSLRENVAIVDAAFDEGLTATEIAESGRLANWDDMQSVFIKHEFWAQQVYNHHHPVRESSGPKPITEPLTSTLEADGIDAMIAQYHELKETAPDDYDFREAHLNQLGYELSYRDRLDEALAVLELNIEMFPESANVYDSYGEMLLLVADTTKAIEYYEKALEVDPEYQNAKTVLERIR